MDSANASDNTLEQTGNQMLNLVHLTNFEHFLKLSQEKSFFHAICEWPIFEQTFKQRYSESTIFCQEEHRASKELLVELRTCLHLVKWNNDRLKEDDVLFSQRDSETRDDTCKDIKKLGSTIELMGFMDKTEKAFVDGFPNHFTAWHQLSVKFMEDIL